MQTIIDTADNTSIKINDISDLAEFICASGTGKACLELRATVFGHFRRSAHFLVCALEG